MRRAGCVYRRNEIAYIMDNYREKSARKIAEDLGRSREGVKWKITQMGLKRTAKERSRIWSGWSRQPKSGSSANV